MSLEITKPDGGQIEGVLRDPDLGREVSFRGWLQLLDLLEETLRRDPGSGPPEPPLHEEPET